MSGLALGIEAFGLVTPIGRGKAEVARNLGDGMPRRAGR